MISSHPEKNDGSLDVKTIAILAFIKQNPGTTENNVSTDMTNKGISSRVTTLKKVQELISSGKVEDLKDNNGFHHLIINESDEFNRIDSMLDQIEILIESMDIPVKNINQRIRSQLKNGQSSPQLVELRDHLRVPYLMAVRIMLDALLVRIMNIIPSERYRQILYSRIIELLQKLSRQHLILDNPIGHLDSFASKLRKIERSQSIKGYAYKIDVDISKIPSLITIIKKFKNQFQKIH